MGLQGSILWLNNAEFQKCKEALLGFVLILVVLIWSYTCFFNPLN